MTLYPTSFVAVTGRDGVAIARDIANESEDRMKGMDLKALFSCVRQATEGREGLCVGEIPPVGNLPSRVMLVAAAPIKNAANEVIGTISAGLTYDSLRMHFRTLKLRRDKSCPMCGEHPTIHEYIDYEGFCALPGGPDAH